MGYSNCSGELESSHIGIMNYLRLYLAIFLSLSLLSWGNARDIYVAQNAVGSNNGVDVANAYGLSWLNNVSNWGAGVGLVSPGDTVHLCGTFTNVLVVQGSGAAGNPITILFEPGANFTRGCWPTTGAIQLNGESWIVVDGGVNGLIQNTSNGTGLTTQNGSRGIGGAGNGTGILYNGVIQNLTITNLYRKTKGSYDSTRAGYGIDLTGAGITISNNIVSDCDGGISYSTSSATQSNVFLLKNTILNCNHSIDIGMGDHNCYMTNLIIAGNYMDHWDVWDCPGNTPIHLDGIILFNNAYDQTTSIMDGTQIYNNTFGGYVGTRTTAAIFTDLGCAVRNYYIYNNFFQCFPPGTWGNGFIGGAGDNCWIVNNTCIGSSVGGTNYGGGIGVGAVNAHLYNNVMLYGSVGLHGSTTNTVSGSQQGTNSFFIVTAYLNSVWSDYNVIVNPVFQSQLVLVNPVNGNMVWLSGIIGPHLVDWQTWYENEWGNGSLGNTPLVPGLYSWAQLHCDPHSSNQMPAFNSGTYIPATYDTVAVGKGTNLTAVAVAYNLPQLTSDINGAPRPATGNWTIGAYQVTGSGVPPPVVLPPSQLQVRPPGQ
jgi:hypothetical protein